MNKLELLENILDEIIRKVPGKDQWILKSKSTGRVLGRHRSKKSALRQERAIQIAKSKS